MKLKTVAFAVWLIDSWDLDLDVVKDDEYIKYMLNKFEQHWLPSLQSEHCGDCTNVPMSCTRCHMEELMMYVEKIDRLEVGNET